MSKTLFNHIQSTRENDSITIIVKVKKQKEQEKNWGVILYKYAAGETLILKTTATLLLQQIKRGEVVFADVYRTPKEELTTGAFDLTTNKINTAHHYYPSINGSGIKVLVKEQN